jgi:uncharacterized membrane protein (DUF2068 family)
MTTQPKGKTEEAHSDPLLRLIAIFKLVKSLSCLAGGIALLHYLNKDLEGPVINLMNSLHVDTEWSIPHWIIEHVEKLANVKTMISLSAIAFFYSILFAVEGTGLYLRKRWAEWFVCIVTGSLLPLEVYELIHKFGWGKVALIVGNLAILAYLIVVIRRKQKD